MRCAGGGGGVVTDAQDKQPATLRTAFFKLFTDKLKKFV